MLNLLLFFGIATMPFTPETPVKIVTLDSPGHEVLRKVAEPILPEEFGLAKEIADKLLIALTPHLPAAGIAAPQIGISKTMFLFSYDRDPKNLEAVINPTFAPIGEDVVEGWEACFSVILSSDTWKIARVPRFDKIKATYFDLEGNVVEKVLEGFAAKVFQHEYDHLQGVENIDRPDAEVKTFGSKEELKEYMKSVISQDATRYTKPN